MSMLGRMFGFGRNEHYDKGIRFFDQGLYEDAIAELHQVGPARGSGAKPDALTQRLAIFYVAEAYANVGTSALQKQEYAKAREALAQALAINPHYADLQFQYGRACRKSGQHDEAIAALEKSLTINPRFVKAGLFLGLCLYETGRPADALAPIRQAVGNQPAHTTDKFIQIFQAHEAGNYAEAHDLLERIAESDADDIAFHSKLGADLYRRGMYEPAADEFRKALTLNPNYADIRNHLAITLNALGLYDEAIAEFERALSINPNYVEARTNLALTLRASGREDEARREFQLVLERDPDNSIALGHLVE